MIFACSFRSVNWDSGAGTGKQGEEAGLGLPIAKKIVEAHRGRMEVVDNLEKGITFRIYIPNASNGERDLTRRRLSIGQI